MISSRGKHGQAALEYILVFVALAGLLAAVSAFAHAARASAGRTTRLVTADTP